MIKIRLKDGDTLIGGSAQDIVTQMKLDDWTKYLNNSEYKTNMERRVVNFYGEELQYSNDLEFLQELQRIGFIQFILLASNLKEE